jgi:uncharacterized protein YndB with AHSA1/START domain
LYGSRQSGCDLRRSVRIHRYDTGIDDLWTALTDPGRLARWMGEVEGDLRLGGEFRFRFFASGSEGTGRVEACEPPRLLLTMALGQPDEDVIEVTLAADGDQTILVWEERGMPLDLLAAYGAGIQVLSKISPPTSPGVSTATPRRGGRSSSLPIETWRPTSARHWQLTARASVRGSKLLARERDPRDSDRPGRRMDMTGNQPVDPEDQALLAFLDAQRDAVLPSWRGWTRRRGTGRSCRRAGRRPGWSSTWAAPSGTGSRGSWPAPIPSRRLWMRTCPL